MKNLFTGFVAVATIFFMMGLAAFVPVASAEVTLSPGDLVKSSESVTPTAVYYYGSDEKLHTFFQSDYYMSWYSDWSGITDISAAELAALDLGSNVMVRPGTRLVKRMTGAAVYAVEAGGVLRHITSEAAAEALYGSDWNKNILSIYDIVWANYDTDGADLDGTAHSEGQLVKPAGGADIYYVGSDGWSKVADMDALTANRFNLDFVVETALEVVSGGAEITGAVAAYTDTAQISTDTSSAAAEAGEAGALSVSGANTPATAYVSKGAQNAIFSKFDVSAVGGDVEISKILISRAGLGYDADVGTVRLYVDGAQLGTDQSVNTNTHKITFKNLDWTIASGETKTLFVKANVAAAPSGTNVSLSIAADDITSDASSILGLPLTGNGMQFSALSVGQFNLTASTNNSAAISGETDKEVGCWNLNTSSTEAFYVDSIKFANIGSASDDEALNFVLKQGSVSIGTAETMSNGKVFIDMTADPYYIDKSKTKKICLYADIKAGITVSKTLQFQVAEAKDAVARGYDSAGEVLTTYSSGTAFVAQSATAVTISQGSATLEQSSGYAPVSGTLVKGVENNKMAAYKLTAGATEGVKLTKLIVTLAGTQGVANTDFANWTLYEIVDGAEVEIPVTGAVSGLTVTFEDTTDGLISVEKSQNKSIVVRGDVSTSASGTGATQETGVHIYVGANGTTNTAARIQGLDSNDYITSGVTLSGVATGNAQTFTINNLGTMAVSKASGAPAADTYAKGTTNVLFNVINFYATGEDMLISDLQVIAYEDAGVTDVADSADITNIRLEDENGNALGTTVASVSSGAASFSFNLTVPKDTNKLVSIYADIPAAASPAGVLHVDFPGDYNSSTASDATDTAAAMTTTGVYSSTDVTETGSVTAGSSMTVAAPTVTATMATTPVAASYVLNSTDVVLGTLVLTASTAEDVKITSIKVSADDDAAFTGATTSADTALTNFELIDSVTGEQYGLTQNLTSGTPDYATFSGITNLTVPKGTSKNVYIRSDVKANSGTYYVGVKLVSTDITGTGALSNASATLDSDPTATAIASALATLTASGTLTFSTDASNPIAGLVAVGAAGTSSEKVMAVTRVSANYENADVTKLIFTLAGSGAAANFQNNGVKLYHQVGSGAETLIGTANVIGTGITYNIPSGTLIIEKGQTNKLTLKALFNGTSSGVTAGSAPRIDFTINTTNVVAKGASSGATLADGALIGSDITGIVQTLRKTIPTFSNQAVSSALTNGIEQDVFAFKVKADSADSVSLKQLALEAILTDIEGTANTLTIGTFKLYRGSTNITGNVSIQNDAGASIGSGGATLGENSGNANTFYIYWTTEEVIPAGTEYTYYLKATTGGYGTSADDDRLQIRIPEDASAIGAVGYRFLVDQDDAGASQSLAYLADTDGANDTAANIIWSDNSVDGYDYTAGAAAAHATGLTDDSDADGLFPADTISSGDWFNGYLVDTTPSNYSVLNN